MALVPPHGLTVKRFQATAPLKDGRPLFSAGDLAIRFGDETRLLRGAEAARYLAATKQPVFDSRFAVDEPGYRIARPDYDDFVVRQQLCDAVLAGLKDDRTYVTSLTGIGGAGKTALAHWGVLEAYKSKTFDFIVSLSAKDRELLASGIQPITPTLTSFRTLLDEILDVAGFGDLKSQDDAAKEAEIRSILTGERFLLLIDNLETIDDVRILAFLETLPKPVKAIITSRRARVRHSVYPVDVGVFAPSEALRFLEIQAERRGRDFILNLLSSGKEAIVQACSFLPLVIEWFVGQADTADKANALSQALLGSARTGEELLEFCFRRIHNQISPTAKRCLKVLSIFDKPESIEPVAAGAQLPQTIADDALDELRGCALVEVVHDPRSNLLTYTMLPLTRKFAYSELVKDQREEADIRRNLTRYFEASDIADSNQRRLISEVRMGVRDPETHCR